ncbi:response regulator [Planctomycetales bacterium ZRK34]|nr:response regulator [Planctomycetales bacterium ZRK34]
MLTTVSTQTDLSPRSDPSDIIIRLGVALCGGVVLILGAIVFYGWVAHEESVVVPWDWSPLMVANTALTSALVGAGLVMTAWNKAPRWIGGALGGAAALLAILTAIQWAFGVDLAVDHLLVIPFTEVGQELAGRMSPHTANTLAMLGAAIVCLTNHRRGKCPLVVPATLAAVSLAIAVAVLIGYVAEYRLPLARTMSIQTVSAVMLLSMGVLGLVHAKARQQELALWRWATGPVVAFVVLSPLLMRFGYIAQDAATGADVVQTAEIIMFGMTAFAVATTIASHLALTQYQSRRTLQELKDRLQDANDTLESRVTERTTALQRHRGHLRALAQQLTLTEQRERRRLAAEMHDYLAQMLVVARMHLSSTRDQLPAEADATSLEQAMDVISESLAYTRTVMARLSPAVLFDHGLVPALQWLTTQDHGRQLQVELTTGVDHVDMPEDHAILLYQATRELLHNVAKHADVDTARIELDLDADTRSLCISVIDAGAGFNAEQWLHNPPNVMAGFGLFNIRERLEVLEGSLDIHSTPGEGTIATIHMPLPSESPPIQEPASQPQTAQPVAGKAVQAGERIRVVIVDDHQLVRAGLRTMIESNRAMEVVAEAGDGAEAFDVIQAVTPDVVLMDINMPVMNGIEATRKIRGTFPDMKILGVTMRDDAESRRAMREAGANELVSKSAIGTEICQRIASLVK